MLIKFATAGKNKSEKFVSVVHIGVSKNKNKIKTQIKYNRLILFVYLSGVFLFLLN